jgi:hypothetical protein
MSNELWLCIRFPQLATEALALAAASVDATASVDGHSASGLHIQRAALERLAAWAYQWSSLISYAACEPLLWLELGASRTLFGGHAALLARIEAGLLQLGYSHVCALAASPSAAALLTRADEPRCVLTKRQLRQRFDSLALDLLELPAATRSALQASGLRRIGELLDLPAAAIARRFGPETSLYLQRLCAQASDPRPTWRAPDTYTRAANSASRCAARRRCCSHCNGYCWNCRAICTPVIARCRALPLSSSIIGIPSAA